jgi:hypothetical protein
VSQVGINNDESQYDMPFFYSHTRHYGRLNLFLKVCAKFQLENSEIARPFLARSSDNLFLNV